MPNIWWDVMTVYPGCSTASLLKSIWKKLLLSFSWYVEWKGDELTYHYSRILQHEEKTKDNASFLKSVFMIIMIIKKACWFLIKNMILMAVHPRTGLFPTRFCTMALNESWSSWTSAGFPQIVFTQQVICPDGNFSWKAQEKVTNCSQCQCSFF